MTVAPSGVHISIAIGVSASRGTAASRGRALQWAAPVTVVRTASRISRVTATFGCSRASPSSDPISTTTTAVICRAEASRASTARHISSRPAIAPGIIAIPVRFGIAERWIHSLIGAAGTSAAPSAAANQAQRIRGHSTCASAAVPTTQGTTARARVVPFRTAGIEPTGIREARSWNAAG